MIISKLKQNSINNTGFGKRTLIKFVLITVAVLISAVLLSACDDAADSLSDDEIVAIVNGEEIPREQFDHILEQEKRKYQQTQGVDLDSEEMAETLRELEGLILENYFIIPSLIIQQAEEAEITVSDGEIEERYQEYIEMFGGEAQLLDRMEALNMNRAELNEDIYQELSVQKYVDYYITKHLDANPAERITAEEVKVTPEEVEEYHRQISEQYEQILELIEEGDPEISREQLEMYRQQLEAQYGDLLEADDLSEIFQQLEDELKRAKIEQLKEEKEQRVLMDHIARLLEESEIEIFLNTDKKY